MNINYGNPNKEKHTFQSCGDSGGRTARGRPCPERNLLDNDGRCNLHPKRYDVVNKQNYVYGSVKSLIEELVKEDCIFATRTTTDKFVSYIKINDIWTIHLSDIGSSFILKRIKNDDVGHSAAVDPMIMKEFASQVKDCCSVGVIPILKSTKINNRTGLMVYKFGDVFIDLKTDKEVKNDFWFTGAFPTFIESTDKKDAQLLKFIKSFQPGFIPFLSHLFHPAHKHTAFMIGVSNAGKTTFGNMLSNCFVENGVGFKKAGDFLQARFNPVQKQLSECFAVIIDEIDKGKALSSSRDWDSIFTFTGQDLMSVEMKGENTLELVRMGNALFIGNIPPPISLNSDAYKNRIAPGDVWIVGVPDISRIIDEHRNRFIKSKNPILSISDFESLASNETNRIKSVNGYYKLPFGQLTDEQWQPIKSHLENVAPSHLTHLLVEALKSNYEQHKETMDIYHEYFSNVADLHRLALGDLNFLPQWIDGGYVHHETSLDEEIDLRKDLQ